MAKKKVAMYGCKECGQTFINKEASAGHDCFKIEPGKATVKKKDIEDKK